MRVTAGILKLGAWAAMALGACGGDAGVCTSVTACGGDIVGTWTITSDCTPPSPETLAGQCDSPDVVGPPTTGTLTYNADLTYTRSITVGGHETDRYAPACFPTEECAQLQWLLRRQSTLISATCVRTSSCTCQIENPPVSVTETGTYTTTPEGLLTVTIGNPSLHADYDYCVKGKTLTVSSVPSYTRKQLTLTKKL